MLRLCTCACACTHVGVHVRIYICMHMMQAVHYLVVLCVCLCVRVEACIRLRNDLELGSRLLLHIYTRLLLKPCLPPPPPDSVSAAVTIFVSASRSITHAAAALRCASHLKATRFRPTPADKQQAGERVDERERGEGQKRRAGER